MSKKVLVVGGGGREHALCWALSKSQSNPEIFCAPGNAGIAQIAHCIDIQTTDLNELVNFSINNNIDFTIVGGETPLAAGIVDKFEAHKLKIVGPNWAASRLESSKSFAKDFMTRHNILTPFYRIVKSVEEAATILRSGDFGDAVSAVVVKADGLAAGKGVIIAKNHVEAINAVKELIENHSNNVDNSVLLEQMLTGREVSLLVFSDGKDFAIMPPARDYKRIGEGNTGVNTGGMGSITDRNLLSKFDLDEIIKKIIEPTLKGAATEGFPFRGILFLGLMVTEKGFNLLEYNVRFGDPEAQSILIKLKSDFVKICESIIKGNLKDTNIDFSEDSSACVILASGGYPSESKVNDVIRGVESVYNDVIIFHSATKKGNDNLLLTTGGRVLGVTAKNTDLSLALDHIYKIIETISWDGIQYRRDIGI